MAETSRAKRALAALKAADQTGTGQVPGGVGAEATDRLADLEACMQTYRCWSPSVIPGLLQVGTYTAGAIKAHTPSLSPEEMTLRVTHRRRRATAFLEHMSARPDGAAWFLVGEQAITRPLQNAHTHGHQLRHLLEVTAQCPLIVLQVLREDSPMPGTLEPFSIYHLETGPRVGHLETVIGGFYTVSAANITRLHGIFSEMIGCAMSVRDSRDYITEVLDSCWTWDPSTEPVSSSPPTATPTTVSTSPVPTPAPSE